MNSFFMRSAVLVTACGSIIAAHAEQKTFKLKQTIALPGVEGRIDHFALDAAGDRLFVCALGNNTVEVLDLRKGQRIHSITGLGAPQGIAYIPELDRLFVANDKGGICKIYDAKSYQSVGEINFKDDADNVRYDDSSKRIYVGLGSGGIGINDAAFTQSAERAMSRSLSRQIRTRTSRLQKFLRQVVLAPAFSFRNKIICLSLFHIMAVRQRRFAVTRSNNLSEGVG